MILGSSNPDVQYHLLPSPPIYVYDDYDPAFGQSVCDALARSLFRDKLRDHKYGEQNARRYKRGWTPEEVRAEYEEMQRQAMISMEVPTTDEGSEAEEDRRSEDEAETNENLLLEKVSRTEDNLHEREEPRTKDALRLEEKPQSGDYSWVKQELLVEKPHMEKTKTADLLQPDSTFSRKRARAMAESGQHAGLKRRRVDSRLASKRARNSIRDNRPIQKPS